MCGITGFFDPDLANPETGFRIVAAMADEIQHRGPDVADYFADEHLPLFLGHRRLSIIDLSPEGRQPMHSASGRYVIVFNGEFYNFMKLRAQLEDRVRFRGHSDTEVFLAAVETWGLEETLARTVGMFAFALWDKQEQILHLARDRMGEKPLYYGRVGRVFFFASELKALCVHPAWRGEIHREVLPLFLRLGYVPAPFSIYKDVRKLTPASFLSIPLRAGSPPDLTAEKETEYWSAADAVARGRANPFAGDDRAAVDELDRLLRGTIADQMISDVPLGAFLSGGIDSSTIVAIMQSLATRPVQTFTIGFHVKEFNEARFAAEIARHLGTDHTELYVTPRETLDCIPAMPRMFDEPFADPSQVPTYLVARLARKKVTVSLSGDGGDELLGGYSRYFHADRIRRRLTGLPFALRRPASGILGALSAPAWDRVLGGLGLVFPVSVFRQLSGEKMLKLAELLGQRSPDLFLYLLSHWKDPARVLPGVKEPTTILHDRPAWLGQLDFIAQYQYLDLLTYLPDDILVKVDRAAMAVSLESRVPLLDHRIVEFAWSLPRDLKIRGDAGKFILRELLARYVPRSLFERPKMGFGVPIHSWLREELRQWAGDLLAPERLRADGFFDVAETTRVWDEHQSGERRREFQLWDLLMFQAWLAEARVDRRVRV